MGDDARLSDITIRCSLENFGSFDYTDAKADGAARHVTICPLYAVSQIHRLMEN